MRENNNKFSVSPRQSLRHYVCAIKTDDWVCKALNRTSLSKEIEIVISLQVVLAPQGGVRLTTCLQGQVPSLVLLFVAPFRTGLILQACPVCLTRLLGNILADAGLVPCLEVVYLETGPRNLL